MTFSIFSALAAGLSAEQQGEPVWSRIWLIWLAALQLNHAALDFRPESKDDAVYSACEVDVCWWTSCRTDVE